MSLDHVLREPLTGVVLDLADGPAIDALLDGAPMQAALDAMQALEAGAIANPDEGRMVGHYWLRAPELAPDEALATAIAEVHQTVASLDAGAHTDLLVIGIGGSALGPQLVADALCSTEDRVALHWLDNTDPEGFARVLRGIDPSRTLAVVISKSGGTVETKNGMLAARAWWAAHAEPWAPHAIAITGAGSRLDDLASSEGWSLRLPLWDWVGGRTSVTGPVGLVPMALAGWDWQGLLAGSASMDRATRRPAAHNPAAWLAATWYAAGAGRGDRALVVLPYRDRLLLLSRYLQQLVMESLGKRHDRQGRVVHQGLTVYGNKGSTDQHAFVQQVRDGRDDVLVCFVEATDPQAAATPGADEHDASDHLLGFLLGTRAALAQAGRPSISIRVPRVDAFQLGALIALFERAVGIYAELIDINAYHQPGVEAGKKAARQTLLALDAVMAALEPTPQVAEVLAARAGVQPGVAWRLLEQLAATGRARRHPGARPDEDAYARR